MAHAQQHSPAFARILAGVDAGQHHHPRAALAQLPVTRKYELLATPAGPPRHSAVGGFATHGFRRTHAARVRQPRHRSMSPKARARTTGAWPAPSTPRAFAPAS